MTQYEAITVNEVELNVMEFLPITERVISEENIFGHSILHIIQYKTYKQRFPGKKYLRQYKNVHTLSYLRHSRFIEIK